MITPIGSGIGAIASQLGNIAGAGSAAASKGASFTDAFQTAVGNVDSLQSSADQQVVNLLQGKGNTDAGQVTVSVEKADVAFQLMMQVRNKIVSAYQDIEKMQF